MDIHSSRGARRYGFAATAALAVGLVTAGPAAATASASVANDTLTVIGTPGADRLALRLAAGDPNTLQVDFGDDGSPEQSVDRATFSRIVVSLENGDDQFRIDQAGGAFADEGLVVDAGSGGDTIVGGDGNDLVLGGSGSDSVSGARGNDTAILGSGRDSFRWLPGEGSDAIDGGDGPDSLVFDGSNAAEIMSLSASGHRTVLLRNVGAIRMDMDDVETLDLAALGGADTVTVNDMTGTGFRTADIDLSAQGVGDGEVDVVTMNGSDRPERVRVSASGAEVDVRGFAARTHITGSESTDRLQLNGRGGDDTFRVGGGAAALIGVAIDGGVGQL
jgi:Ca2+-binding RTX toxin-like protein